MSEPFVPGPHDHYRGVVEVDCSEFLPPELKAKLRIGKFVPVAPPIGDLDPEPSPRPKDNPASESES